MAKSNIIKAVITGDADGLKKALGEADTSLGRFKSSVAGADTVGGKFKAGFGSVAESVKANAGAMAIGAGTALVTFGLHAVHAFEAAAKAALDLGAATGLGTEEASRWIAVADDAGVSAESLAGGVGKIAKSLDDTKWAEYGIATRDASGSARSANDVLIDSLDMLGQISNATERARVGNELFGKGYSSLAPLIGKTRAEYEGMLGSVAKGEVITAKEAEKAERMRLAEDALADALSEVTLAFGELVAEMAPAIEKGAEFVSWVTEATDKLGPLASGAFAMAEDVGDALFGMSDDMKAAIADMEAMVVAAEQSNGEFHGLANASNETGIVIHRVRDEFHGLASSENAAKEATRQLDAAYKELTGSLSQEEALINLNRGLREYNANLQKGEWSMEDARLAQIGLQQEMLAYTATLKGIPPEVASWIRTNIEQGNLDEVRQVLADLTKPEVKTVTVNAKAGSGWGSVVGGGIGTSGQRATGGPVSAGQVYQVNEQGMESFADGAGRQFLIPPVDGRVIPAAETARNMRGSGGVHIGVVNVTDGRSIHSELALAALLHGGR